MHDTWKQEPEARAELYAKVKRGTEHLLADCTATIMEHDARDVIKNVESLTETLEQAEIGTMHEHFSQMSEEQLANMLGWAVVGIKCVFLRSLETAVMSDELEDA